MKKLLSALLAVVLLIVLVGPVITGSYAQQRLKSSVKQMSAPGAGLQVALKGFQRGWLTDTAELTVHVKNAILQRKIGALIGTSGKPAKAFAFHETIYNGPIAFGSWSSAEPVFIPVLAATRFIPEDVGPSSFLHKLHLNLTGIFNFDGSVRSRTHLGPLNLDMQNNSHLQWQGLTFNATASANFQRVNYHGQAGSLTLRSQAMRFTFAALKIHGHQHRDPLGYWPGHFHMSMPMFAVTAHQTPVVKVRKTTVDAKIKSADGRIAESIATHTGPIHSKYQNFKSLHYTLNIKNIDERALNDLRSHLAALQSQHQKQASGIIKTDIAQLLQAKPSLELAPVKLSSATGDIDARLALAFQPTAPGSSLATLQQAAQANASVRIAKPLANHIATLRERQAGIKPARLQHIGDARLAQFVSAGYLKAVDNHYLLKYRYANGMTYLNGKRLSHGRRR